MSGAARNETALGGWRQTHREWGNGRTIKGVAHFMEPRRGDMFTAIALCGYVPHEHTQMVRARSVVPHCRECLRRRGYA